MMFCLIKNDNLYSKRLLLVTPLSGVFCYHLRHQLNYVTVQLLANLVFSHEQSTNQTYKIPILNVLKESSICFKGIYRKKTIEYYQTLA